MQKQLLDYEIHWEMNGLLLVSFNPEHLRVKYFKGGEQLMQQLKEAKKSYDLKYPVANGFGPMKL